MPTSELHGPFYLFRRGRHRQTRLLHTSTRGQSLGGSQAWLQEEFGLDLSDHLLRHSNRGFGGPAHLDIESDLRRGKHNGIGMRGIWIGASIARFSRVAGALVSDMHMHGLGSLFERKKG